MISYINVLFIIFGANLHEKFMQLNLTRNLCFLDIESTGLNVIRDRIIQIAIVKYLANGHHTEGFSQQANVSTSGTKNF